MTDLRSAAERHDKLLADRLDLLVPGLLAEEGIDAWVLIGREYAEDPVLATMLPADWITARRRTILVLTATDRFSVSRYPVGDLFRPAWDPDVVPDQWDALSDALLRIDPQTIGIGTSPDQAHADGLTATEHDSFMRALPDGLASKVVSAGRLGIRWLETRLPSERGVLEQATIEAHHILRSGLTRQAITPGQTTTNDLVWWYRETVRDAGYDVWFQPTVSVQRANADDSAVIKEGDLIHVDFGITFHNMCTDQQEHGYVLQTGETTAPHGLTEGLKNSNEIQDILMAEFVSGRTGNEILKSALDRCADRGLDATIYTHSIGLHGHGAGMTIGLWDQQNGVPGAGDHPLYANTAYSIELMGESTVHEWGDSRVRFMLEQDAWFDGEVLSWLDGRQTNIHVI